MRLAFLGTPELAVPPLRALVDAGHEVVLVVTRPDRRRGRGAATSPSPVKAAALDLELRVSHDHEDVIGAGAELGVVVAYGRIIPADVLAAVPMVNLHFSRLPRWRGAAPVERAILAGDTETAVDLMGVEEGLDTGPVYARRVVPIGERATLEELRAELVAAGTELLVDTLAGPLPTPVPQSGEVVVAAKIDPAERHLDWSRPAVELDRVVRLGGAWTTWRGRRLKVNAAVPLDADAGPPGSLHPGGEVGTGVGVLRLVTVQPEGKPPMEWRDFANGARIEPGDRLGVEPHQ